MKKSRQEMLSDAARIAKEHDEKKKLIQKILNDLDSEENVTQKHLDGIATVNEILKELEDLEIKHAKVLEEIKQ